jgi:hypothetical protein
MEGYKNVIKKKAKTKENEIIVTSEGDMKNYLKFALRVLT